MLHKGLVIVTGPTGSGKSTTLATMLDYANKNRRDHIITMEDPIEFVHESKNCLVNQREVGVHTKTFASGLRGALREDPDVVLIGEMRDLETIELAILAANTGHLVFGTLHTPSAAKTVDRIIDVFPADQQNKIRATLAESLKGIVAKTFSGGLTRKAAWPRWRFWCSPRPSPTSFAKARPTRFPAYPGGQEAGQPAARRRHHGAFAHEAHFPRGSLRQVH